MTSLTINVTQDNVLIVSHDNIPKIRISYICYITQRELNFEDKYERKDKSVIFMIIKDKKYRIPISEFDNTYFDYLKEGRIGQLSGDIIKELINPSFLDELKKKLYNRSLRINLTDCWWPFNFDYNLKYTESLKESINYTPIKTISIVEHERLPSGDYILDEEGNPKTIVKEKNNKNYNIFHNFYNLFEMSLVKDEDFKYLSDYIKDYYKVSMPQDRWEFINLLYDYSFAGLFKHNMWHDEFGGVKFPILLITGKPGTGKTTTIQHILRMFYNKDSDFKFNASDISGSSPLTRIKLSNNSVLPVLLDELSTLESLAKIINTYLTEGYLVDKTVVKTESKTRKCHYNIMIATNAIKLEQYGSDAISERFCNYELTFDFDMGAEVHKKYNKFTDTYRNNTQRLGRALLFLFKKYEHEMKDFIKKYLNDNSYSISQGNQRNYEKTKYFLIGSAVRLFLNTTPELSGTFTENNNVDFYNDLVNGKKHGGRVITRAKEVVKIFNDMIKKVIKEGGKNIYLTDLFKNNRYEKFCNVCTGKNSIPDADIQYQDVLKYLYYYANEFGLMATTEYGYFVIRKDFYNMVSDRLVDKSKLLPSDFAAYFKEYIKLRSNGDYIISTCDYINVNQDITSNCVYDFDIKKTSRVIKFNLLKFIEDLDIG